jgi:hypothetical protein
MLQSQERQLVRYASLIEVHLLLGIPEQRALLVFIVPVLRKREIQELRVHGDEGQRILSL